MKRGAKLLLALVIMALAVALVIAYLGKKPSGNGTESVSALEISEVMSSNKGSVSDANGDYPDWIELHNTSSAPLDIGGMGLGDDITKGPKYVFPAGTELAADGYIIVWCSGESTDAEHAPFRISASDSVVLFGASGNSMETLVLHAVDSGMSYAKDSSGIWGAMLPSPGFENTEAGVAAYEATLMSETGTGIYINEFMASNSTTLIDAYGNYSDWIELYNATDADFDLSGCGISDSLTQPKKYVFPEGAVIPARGYLVVFCSGSEGFAENGELHAPFGLRAYGEDVVLSSRTGAIMDSITYTNQQKDVSFARTPDGTGEFAASAHPTPGFSNSDEGYNAFMAANTWPKGDIFISEMLGANVSARAAGDGGSYDLIELHNAGSEPASLLGYALSDNPNNPGMWAFPDVEIPAGGYIVVFASGLNKYENNELHANFSISREGDSAYLFSPEGTMLDKLQAGAFLNDVSYGRDSSGTLAYFETPTFGAANGEGKAGITAVPVFSTTPGVYDAALDITIAAPEGETVYYTLDCTTPTAGALVYTGPIHADKNTVVRAVCMRDGYITNESASGTFLFKSDGADHALEIATLVTDPDNLWSTQTGIYAYGDGYDPDLGTLGEILETAQYYQSKDDPEKWEREACFSVYDASGMEAFSQNIGIRIAGSFGRARAQKGFNIFARDEYGADRMEYKFFDGLDYTEYKSLVLRAGGQDQSNGKFRDELATGLLAGSDIRILYQAYRPYVLYLNGEYWGVYFLKEKRNRFFVAQHEGMDNNTDLDIVRSGSYAYYGSASEWAELMQYVNSHDLTDSSAYAYVDERVDLGSFMDYMICELYSANSDVWNIQYYKVDGGKWRWIYYDFCWSFGSSENQYNHKTVSIRRLSTKPCSDLFNALLKVPAWKDAFCRRFAELLNTVYAPETVLAKIDELYAICAPEIEREREKFNSSTWLGVKQPSVNISSVSTFEKHVAVMREFAQKRPQALIDQMKSEFGLSDSYVQEVFG